MSPELEVLLRALYEKRTCPPHEKEQRSENFERLLDDAVCRRPGTSRDELLEALEQHYREYRRAQRRPPTLPPVA